MITVDLETTDELDNWPVDRLRAYCRDDAVTGAASARLTDRGSKAGLDPIAATVACAVLHLVEDGQVRALSSHELSEREVINGVWSRLERHLAVVSATNVLCTFNGVDFDIPFLIARSIVLGGIEVPRRIVDAKPWDTWHVDVQRRLSVARARPTLDAACQACGIPSPKGDLHGADVGAAWRRGEYDRVIDYCRGDVLATTELGMRVRATVGP